MSLQHPVSYQLKKELEEILHDDPAGAYLYIAQFISPMKKSLPSPFKRDTSLIQSSMDHFGNGGLWYEFYTHDIFGNKHQLIINALKKEDRIDIRQVYLAINDISVRAYYLTDSTVRDDRDIFGKDFYQVSKMYSHRLAKESAKRVAISVGFLAMSYAFIGGVVKIARVALEKNQK